MKENKIENLELKSKTNEMKNSLKGLQHIRTGRRKRRRKIKERRNIIRASETCGTLPTMLTYTKEKGRETGAVWGYCGLCVKSV